MMPLTVLELRTILTGELIQGSDDVIIKHGAYRLKQVKKRNTVLFSMFSKQTVFGWEALMDLFPLIIVTDQEFIPNDRLADLTVIKVNNAEEAYWKFVHYYRNLFTLPVIAITGTSGKTTIKEMIRHIASFDKAVVATHGTNNSRTAHLHYLLTIDDDTEVAVIEAAVGAPGDVLNAGEYFKPTIGIIANIGAHHLNYCHTLKSYINAKGEMVEALNNTGTIILNADDRNSNSIDLTNYNGSVIKFGVDTPCHFQATNITYSEDGMQFNLLYKQKTYPIFVPGYGEHQVYNMLATIAAVHELGVSIPEATERITTFQHLNKHLQVFEGLNGATILDDTWSMTTTSLEAALKVLNELGKTKKTVAIVGTITDLGSWGYKIHEQAGEMICHHGVDVLITIGMHARIIADFVANCDGCAQVYSFNNDPLVYNLLKKIVDENTIVLIKGDMYSKPISSLAAKIRKAL